MTIGEVIRKYRKQAGITQEEMAGRLGVTAPAVNKWENNNTQPDIALLPPIARLLGINMDTLFSFDSLSAEEVTMLVRKLDQDLDRLEYAEVFAWMKEKLEKYPNCDVLLWQAAVILNARRIMDNVPDSEKYEKIILGWFERCLESENEIMRKAAADSLFQAYLQKEEYEKAFSYISYLSSDSPERKRKEAVIYSKTGRKEEAYRTYEELLFSHYQFARLVFNDLRILYMEDNDHNMARKLTEMESQLAKVFEMGRYYEVCSELDIAAWEKNAEETERIMRQILESMDQISAFTKSELYRHMSFKEAETAFADRMKEKIIEGMEDKSFSYMKGNEFWEEMTAKQKSL